jgi:hypothetical protein
MRHRDVANTASGAPQSVGLAQEGDSKGHPPRRRCPEKPGMLSETQPAASSSMGRSNNYESMCDAA